MERQEVDLPNENQIYITAYLEYSIGKKTADQVAKDLHIGRKKLLLKWQELGLNPKKLGRPETPLRTDLLPTIHEIKAKYNLGYKKVLESYIHDDTVSFHDMLKLYEKENLFKFRRDPEKIDEHPNQYVSQYVNQQWHTDLKSFKEETNGTKHTYHLNAFIDDRSRFCIYYEILPDKTMKSTSKALQNAIDSIKIIPYELLTDNGCEFTGKDFKNVLQVNGIQHHRTEPYTPQLNGKIERFWQTIFSARPDFIEIREFLPHAIEEYNTVWVHTALKDLFGGKPTPKSIWDQGPKWTKDLNPNPEFEIQPRN